MTTNYDNVAAAYPHESFFMKYIDGPELFRMMGDVTGKSILDIGCGRGEHTRRLKALRAARVVGMDYSAEMLRLAQVAENESPMGIEYRQADMYVPQQLGPFDIVMAYSVLSIAPTKDKLLKACQMISMNLKPGGRFVTAGINTEQDPETYGVNEKYGIRFWADLPLVEGGKLYTVLLSGDENFVYEDYYFTHATYEWALRASGFREIRWHTPVVPKTSIEKFGVDFWHDYVEHGVTFFLECTK